MYWRRCLIVGCVVQRQRAKWEALKPTNFEDKLRSMVATGAVDKARTR